MWQQRRMSYGSSDTPRSGSFSTLPPQCLPCGGHGCHKCCIDPSLTSFSPDHSNDRVPIPEDEAFGQIPSPESAAVQDLFDLAAYPPSLSDNLNGYLQQGAQTELGTGEEFQEEMKTLTQEYVPANQHGDLYNPAIGSMAFPPGSSLQGWPAGHSAAFPAACLQPPQLAPKSTHGQPEPNTQGAAYASLYGSEHGTQQASSRGDHECDQCQKSYRRNSELKRHVEINHENKPKPYVCIVCGKGFHWQASLERHMATHSKDKTFDCASCSRKFTRADNRNRHEKKCHP